MSTRASATASFSVADSFTEWASVRRHAEGMDRAVGTSTPFGRANLGMETLPISTRGEASGAFEQAAKEGGILVADLPADCIHRHVGPLELLLRILDPQALNVGNRREAGRAHEAPFEGACRELGTLDHLLHRVGNREMLAQPLLCTLDIRVTVIRLAFEHDVRRESVVMPLQREHPRYFLRGGGTRVARDEVQHQIVPGRRCA
jgi:hypothetical protein